jgi:hypothetical protein
MHKVAYTITKHVAEYHLQAERVCSSELVLAWRTSQKNDIVSIYDIYQQMLTKAPMGMQTRY